LIADRDVRHEEKSPIGHAMLANEYLLH